MFLPFNGCEAKSMFYSTFACTFFCGKIRLYLRLYLRLCIIFERKDVWGEEIVLQQLPVGTGFKTVQVLTGAVLGYGEGMVKLTGLLNGVGRLSALAEVQQPLRFDRVVYRWFVGEGSFALASEPCFWARASL